MATPPAPQWRATGDDRNHLWPLISWRSQHSPDDLFAVDEAGTRVCFEEFANRCRRVGAALVDHGVTKGTRVAWMLPTRHEAFVLAGALAYLGAVQIPLIPILRDREVGFILAKTQAEILFCPGHWRGYDYPALAHRVTERDDVRCKVIVVDPDLPDADADELGPAAVDNDDALRWIFFTSGTTSAPKGVLHSDGSVAACAERMNERFDTSPADRNGLVFPVTHIGGIAFLMGGLMDGYAHILVETFDPQRSCDLLAREGVTMAGAGPVFWMTYVDQQRRFGPTVRFPQLRALLGGGAPKPPTIHDDVREVLGVVLATGYGLTECPTAAHSSVHDPHSVLRADGRPLADTEIRIVAGDGQPAVDGQIGEIRVRGPMLFRGYLDPIDNEGAFDDDGFHRTGDLGWLNGDVLTVTGRLKDIIIRKGENISAKEIEDALYTHPAVADVGVIAVPDRVRGELACAVVVLAPGFSAPTLGDFVEHCVGVGLSSRKLPEQLEFIDVLPRNPTGKVLKYELQARFGEPIA